MNALHSNLVRESKNSIRLKNIIIGAHYWVLEYTEVTKLIAQISSIFASKSNFVTFIKTEYCYTIY